MNEDHKNELRQLLSQSKDRIEKAHKEIGLLDYPRGAQQPASNIIRLAIGRECLESAHADLLNALPLAVGLLKELVEEDMEKNP